MKPMAKLHLVGYVHYENQMKAKYILAAILTTKENQTIHTKVVQLSCEMCNEKFNYKKKTKATYDAETLITIDTTCS